MAGMTAEARPLTPDEHEADAGRVERERVTDPVTGVLPLVARVAQQWWTREAGEPWAGLRPEVRLRLAIALVVTSWAWVGLAAWSERAAPSGRPPAEVTGQVVDVTVAPAGHPPVGLVVVASPPGSSLAVGSVIASVPGKVWLDLDGHWSFEARFGERRSPTVDLILPFERVLQLAFPSPAAP